jgi:hypothetical protein
MSTYGGTSKQPTKDTYLTQYAPTTNYEATTVGINALNTNWMVGLFEFDLSDFPEGAILDTAEFYAYYSGHVNDDAVGRTYNCYKQRRIGANGWVENQATWNIFKTSNNWGTAGCANTSTDVDETIVSNIVIPASPGWVHWDVKEHLQDAIDNALGVLSLKVKDNAANAANNQTLFHARTGANPCYLVVTLVAPAITASAATNITNAAARLNGELTDDNGISTTVKVYWGETDGEDDPEAWDHFVNLGTLAEGTFYTDLAELTPSTKYYFRTYATNANGEDWADATLDFTTGTPYWQFSGTVYNGENPQPGATVFILNANTQELIGVQTTDVNGEYTCVEPSVSQPIWHLVFQYDAKATLTTDLSVEDADLVFTAIDPLYPGLYGNAISVKYLGGVSQVLAVSVAVKCIIVQLETDGDGIPTSTAAEVLAVVNAHVDAKEMVLATLADGNDGSGLPVAMTETALSGGECYHDYSYGFCLPTLYEE